MMSVFGFERVTVLKVTLVAAAAVLAGCLLALLETAKPVEAAFPGTNGKIAFTRSGEIYTMNADGSGVVKLTNNSALNEFPVFSPDGTKIAFASVNDGTNNSEIYTMNADGSGVVKLTNNSAWDNLPKFSPDGTKIVFASDRDGNEEIYIMKVDGSGQVNLTNNPVTDEFPVFSPDGTKIAFASQLDGVDTEIYTMNPDGSKVVRLTNNGVMDNFPEFSPDGTKIVFASQHDDLVIIETDIYSMNPDGSGRVNLTNNPALDSLPAFSPDGTKIAFYSERDVYNGQINGEIYTMNPDGSGQVNLTNSSPDFDLTPNWGPLVRPTYDFSGFFQPVDNLPTLNKTKAGKTIPIRFSLGGDRGLAIFDNIENPNPKSEPIDCSTRAPIDEIEQTVTGTGALSYNAGSGRYEYDWGTMSAWSGTCRQFVMKLNDGTVHRANFTFK